jgi:cysteine synthase B
MRASQPHPFPRERPDRSLLERVGRTSLLRLRALEPASGVEIHAKAEWENPGGSVKDRPAWRMVEAALRSRRLERGRRLIDATSGNTGIAYAWIGAALGLPVTVVLPSNVTRSRRERLRELGAEVLLTDPDEGMDGAIETVRRLVAAHPGRYHYLDQYGNPENWLAHYAGTGPEILLQTGGRVTHFVAGLGTTGTFVGVGRRLRQERFDVALVAVQPDSPLHALEGLKHLASAQHVPSIHDPALTDHTETVSTEEARAMAFRLRREIGIAVGPSAAANAVAAVRVASGLERGVVVTVFPDAADKYLDEPFWKEKPDAPAL